jgi:hypothetical protein
VAPRFINPGMSDCSNLLMSIDPLCSDRYKIDNIEIISQESRSNIVR